MPNYRIFMVTSLHRDEECLIKIRGSYYRALTVPCVACGLDFKLLEDPPSDIDMAEGWDSSVMMGSHYASRIEEDPTLIIPYDENDIRFWKSKDA